jgi:TonB-linked SusC/RagA family outer membrane protein
MKHQVTDLFNGSYVKGKSRAFCTGILSFTMCAGIAATPGHAAEKPQLNLFSTALVSEKGSGADLVSKYEFQVSGTVKDEEGTPLPGVTVVVKGTTIGASTNADGNFNLTLPDEQSNGTLVFSYIGYSTQEVPLNGQTNVNVTMVTDAQALEEVVVTGYGTQRKSDVTGSVGVVNSEELLQAPVNNALQGLQGRVAGVNVKLNSGSPTSSPRVVIRGVGTINASSSPLYVVDGVVMEDIQFLNPNDIESMEVLKDASSTAIYGARGANGVILVTTRRGALTEGIVVGYDGFVSIGEMRKKMDLLNAEEWLQVVETGMANTPKYRPDVNPVFTKSDPNLFDANGNPLYDTDWQEEATRTAVSHNHQLSLQTKGEKSSFGTFLNYSRMEGIMLNSWLERVNGKVAYDASPKKWFSFGVNLLVNYTRENEAEEGGGHQMPRRTMIEMPPIFPVRFPDGTWSNSSMISDKYNLEGMANPVHVLETQDRLRNRTQLFGNTYLTFHLLPGLDLRTQFGFDKHNRNFQEYYPTDLANISAPLGRAFLADQQVNYWQEETFLSYNKEMGDHRINSVLGLSWQERTFQFNSAEARGFADDVFRFNNMGAASQPGAPQSGYEKWSLNSYFLRGGYAFKDKYLLTLTGRVDGSSRFGEDNKYGFFPSLGVGWVVSNEPFLQNVSDLNQLKLRASYGVTGNTEIPTYASLATVSSGTVLIGGERQTQSFPSRMPNPGLQWERTKQFDVGFDARLFNHRVGLEFDYYYKLTTDLLLDRPLPNSTGFGSVRDNIGSLSNRGIEAMITTTNIDNSDFRWESTLNFNYNKNKIEELGENDEDIFPGPYWVSGSQTILRVGESVSSFWGYERIGTWGTDEAEAAAEVGAVPGEAKRSAERKILGKGLPDWSGSFINNFQYKNFDLSVDLQFVYGVDILQQFYHSTEDRSGIANGLRTILTEGWTPQNQNTMVQEIRNQAYAGQNSEIDSRWVTNGSYLRGNLISLGYNFDNTFLPGLNLKALRVYASLQNAFVIHSDDFQGYDPEATSWGGAQWGQNIFFFQYPRPRTYTLGLNVKF